MTAGRIDQTGVDDVLRDLRERIRQLEAVPPGIGVTLAQGVYSASASAVPHGGTGTPLSWAYVSGDVLLDLTNPLTPAILVDALYSADAIVGISPDMTPGGTIFASLEWSTITASDQRQSAPAATPNLPDNLKPGIHLTIPIFFVGAATIALEVFNQDPAIDLDFGALITLQKIQFTG